MRHIPWLLGCLLLGCSSDATPPLDVETFCADLAAYEGVEVNLEFRIDPSLVLRFGSSGALCGETMPCCNTAQYVYLLPGCNGARVALSGKQAMPVAFTPGEEIGIVDQAIFDDFGIACAQFAFRQGIECGKIG